MTLSGFLEQYGDIAENSMNKRTMASILWATHVQARYFSTEKMESRNDTVLTFAAMMMCVQATQSVIIGDVPPSLYQEKNHFPGKSRLFNTLKYLLRFVAQHPRRFYTAIFNINIQFI